MKDCDMSVETLPTKAPLRATREPSIEGIFQVSAAELERLFSLKHRNPHAILGAHPSAAGVTIRIWRAGARSVSIIAKDGTFRTTSLVHPAGLFEAQFPDRREVFRYWLRIEDTEGRVSATRDPYSFLPTLGDFDLHLFGEGRHAHVDLKMGAQPKEVDGASGVAFAVWAPNAEGVSVVGEWNGWDGRLHPMRMMGSSGIWELFIPEVRSGALYKYEIHGADGRLFLKSDPYAQAMEVPPGSASIIHLSQSVWRDGEWIESRGTRSPWKQPMSIYEVHLGSWCRVLEEGRRPMTYREIAPFLAGYAKEMGFTHVELLPVMEHPYGPSWGYQVGGYYAPTARFGSPDDFAWLVDYFHRQSVGVILDWVPAHFPKDAAALGRFDGTALYEHWDRRLGEHPDWNTYVFNYGRHEVRNFLVSNALFWLDRYHVDGLRLDAVASMLYLDYSRPHGDWIPNQYGGRENLEAIAFLRELNERVYSRYPNAVMVAEESTAWPAVSRPTTAGGLGFGFKWNMGWMHDTLEYFSKDPIFRRHHHHLLTFGLLYAWNENFVLPLSHDEVVHGKRSLLSQMPGDRADKFANLRSLFAHMWAHPGKKLLFMGGEFGQWNEWTHDASLDWHLLREPDHQGLQRLVRDLNRIYREEPALWEEDFHSSGFEWVDALNADENILAFLRVSPASGRILVAVSNLSKVGRTGYRLALPRPGRYCEVLNTDAALYGGENRGNAGEIQAEPIPHHGRPCSATIVLPPLSTLWFEAPQA